MTPLCEDVEAKWDLAKEPIREQNYGWELIRSEGSHYIYRKGGRVYTVLFHGAKEVGKGIEKKIKKEMELQ